MVHRPSTIKGKTCEWGFSSFRKCLDNWFVICPGKKRTREPSIVITSSRNKEPSTVIVRTRWMDGENLPSCPHACMSTLVSTGCTAINPRSRNHAPFVLFIIRNKRNRCNRPICGYQLVAPSSSHISLTSGRRSSARACDSSLLPEKGHTPHNKSHATFPKQCRSFGNVIVYRRWRYGLIRVSDLYNVERFLRSRDRFVLPIRRFYRHSNGSALHQKWFALSSTGETPLTINPPNVVDNHAAC